MEGPQEVETNVDVPIVEEKTAKRKVGRPIAYQGNPFSPDVTPEQRRVILRRVANRESARRVRERRHEELERTTQKADYLERSNDILCRKLKKAQAHETQLQGYLTQLNRDILAKDHENAGLRTTIAHMRECEAMPYPSQSTLMEVLPKPSGFSPCTEFPIQPNTPSTINASWLDVKDFFARDGEWLACLDKFAKEEDAELSSSSFFKG